MRVFLASLGLLFLASTANASILVGTVKTSQTESISEINTLIAEYNTRFGASLASVASLIDKLQDVEDANGNTTGTEFEKNFFNNDHFTFFEQDNSGTKQENIFDTLVKFSESDLGGDTFANSFKAIDNPVFGFELNIDYTIDYYVSKDGNQGWSLWAAMDGFNPVYTDASTVDDNNRDNVTISTLGAERNGQWTQGLTTNSSIAYDPIKSGVSHISFYSSSSDPTPLPPMVPVPEPSSLTLWGLGLIGVAVARRRRRR